VDVSDRFGGYGLTGVVIFRAEASVLVVDTFLLSCRVLGRGVEHRLLARLGEIAVERGLARIDLPFVPTARNKPARLFLESVAQADGEGVFNLRAEAAPAVRYRPDGACSAPARAVAQMPPARARIDYVRIAMELRDPRLILERIEGARPAANGKAAGSATPR